MFFPLYTDQRLRTTPWMTYGLVVLNVVIYAFTWRDLAAFSAGGVGLPRGLEQFPAIGYYLWPGEALTWLPQFVTYMFLHSPPQPAPLIGIQLPMHLLFNMVFLLVFGHPVEERLGRFAFLSFYLAAGVVAGIGHCLTSTAPVLGASGAVAGVVGAYLALFPRSDVTVGYWLIVMFGTFQISSVLLILFQFLTDLFFQFSGFGGNVAYTAHLAGYVFGFGVPMLLLLTRVLPRDDADMVGLLGHWRRRRRFRRLSKQGFRPWEGDAAGSGADSGFAGPEADALIARRESVRTALTAGDPRHAATLYASLLNDHPDQVFDQDTQLTLSNQLMTEQSFVPAAKSYELFLAKHPGYDQRPSVELILGLLYARHGTQPARAKELLTAAADSERLDDDNRELARATLAELE